MKKMRSAEEADVAVEYDFRQGRPNPYADRANTESNLVLIDPDLYAVFPSNDAVNNALRLIVKASTKAVKHKGSKAKAS